LAFVWEQRGKKSDRRDWELSNLRVRCLLKVTQKFFKGLYKKIEQEQKLVPGAHIRESKGKI